MTLRFRVLGAGARLAEVLFHDVRGVLALERVLPREEVQEGDAERINVVAHVGLADALMYREP